MRVVEQDLDIQIVGGKGIRHARHHQVDAALLQLTEFQRADVGLDDVTDDVGISLRKSVDGVGHQAGGEKLGAGDAHLAGRQPGQPFDILDALAQFVEHDMAALEQRGGIDRRRNAARAAVEQTDAERAFQTGDRFRHHRLRRIEMGGGLRHAAPAHDDRQDMQVAQPEPPADSALPVAARLCHR